jgi:hypothetical protein
VEQLVAACPAGESILSVPLNARLKAAGAGIVGQVGFGRIVAL